MKVLFIAGGISPASVFALAPLATAVRNAGHEILVAAFDELTPSVEAVGLPPIAVVTGQTAESIKLMDRPGGRIDFPHSPEQELPFVGNWFARQAAVSIDGLLALSRDWRPDLVVGGSFAYAAGLIAAHLGVPHVREAWDWLHFDGVDDYANEELRPELTALGLDRLPDPDMFLDICPPSLRHPQAKAARMIRWIPGNRQRKLERWMYARDSRGRVCVTLGSRAAEPPMFAYLCELVDKLTKLDVDVVFAANEASAAELRARFPQVRGGWVPLEFLAPTCDAIVHPSGGLTAMNAMAAGTPQVIFNRFDVFNDSLRLLEKQGCATVLYRGDDAPENAATACEKVLSDPSYARQARTLADEIATMPTPPEVIADLEELRVS
jgi:UDP:flavonoid glycosyltransferase YjiC (YdhE family)